MNFLAHLYLSGNSEKILIGNYIGDYVKGKGYEKYKNEIKHGILLHRKIDSFTDSHPVVKRSKSYFNSKYRKYSGIIIDVVYDHFLSLFWYKFSKIPLNDFIYQSYEIILNNYNILPARVKQFTPNFIIYNWLETYGTIDGLEKVFNRMSKKTSLPKETEFAINELRTNYLNLGDDFNEFFPSIIEYVKKII